MAKKSLIDFLPNAASRSTTAVILWVVRSTHHHFSFCERAVEALWLAGQLCLLLDLQAVK
jgi:hypothetical protein